jgi:LPPG:FO 2-phospho-L-lactate transferase
VKVVALAGGVGGAKLAWGLAKILDSDELSIIVNTGDDFELFGLSISPDIDTVCYTMAGWSNPQTGWGRAAETWNSLEEIKKLGGPDWFNLGDKDLALHLERTRLLREGKSLSEVTAHLSGKMSIQHQVLPMSDQPVHTIVNTKEFGELPFQEYFVKHQCRPIMIGRRFEGIEEAQLTVEGRRALEETDLVVFCPSNPWVSIDPILGIEDTREIISEKAAVAVSPIIDGKTVKGPAAKMYSEMGIKPSALAVAEHYKGIIKGLVIDEIDKDEMQQINRCGIMSIATQTLMSDNQTRETLARETILFAERFKKV